jgi:hypothetical protein
MDLKEILGEELFNQVSEKVSEKNINLIADDKNNPGHIPKSRLDEVIAQKNQFKTQASELTSELDKMKESAKGNEELMNTIQELESKTKEWEGKNAEWEIKNRKTKIDAALKIAAMKYEAHDVNDVNKYVNYDNISIDENDEVNGAEEEIKSVLEQKPYLFKQKIANKGSNPPGAKNHTPDKGETREQLMEQIRKNPNDKRLMERLFKLNTN